MFTTYNLLLLAEESVTLQGLVELALRDVRKDLVLSFISGAVWDSEKENAGIYFFFCPSNAMLQNLTCVLIRGTRKQSMKSASAAGLLKTIHQSICSIRVSLGHSSVFRAFAYIYAAAEWGQCLHWWNPTAGKDGAEQQEGINHKNN